MQFSLEFIAFAAATLVTSSLASPVGQQQQQRRAPAPGINCNDVTTGVGPNCWTSLKVADYITTWKVESSSTCEEGEAWSICFNNLVAMNGKGGDCTEINSTKCAKPEPSAPHTSAQGYYGSYNTWCKFFSRLLVATTEAYAGRVAINQFFTAWSEAIKYIAKGNPSIINDAATPADFDTFLAAKNKNMVSIDVALNNLISRASSSPQTDALKAALETFETFSKYDSSKVSSANPPIATLMDVRLQQLLRHVETNVPSFIAMGKNGAFSQANVASSASLVKELWPQGGAIASIDH
ncbi:MAG: hypothetical protein Q9219_002462 [cf. Caloplaca sp. 3 TL-2023]